MREPSVHATGGYGASSPFHLGHYIVLPLERCDEIMLAGNRPAGHITVSSSSAEGPIADRSPAAYNCAHDWWPRPGLTGSRLMWGESGVCVEGRSTVESRLGGETSEAGSKTA